MDGVPYLIISRVGAGPKIGGALRLVVIVLCLTVMYKHDYMLLFECVYGRGLV